MRGLSMPSSSRPAEAARGVERCTDYRAINPSSHAGTPFYASRSRLSARMLHASIPTIPTTVAAAKTTLMMAVIWVSPFRVMSFVVQQGDVH